MEAGTDMPIAAYSSHTANKSHRTSSLSWPVRAAATSIVAAIVAASATANGALPWVGLMLNLLLCIVLPSNNPATDLNRRLGRYCRVG